MQYLSSKELYNLGEHISIGHKTNGNIYMLSYVWEDEDRDGILSETKVILWEHHLLELHTDRHLLS